MHIRTASDADFAALSELLRQLNPDDPAPSDASRAAFDAILMAPNLHLFVAEDADGLCGTCYLNVLPNLSRAGRPYALIENVVTDAARCGQGIGEKLMQTALAAAREAGCYKVMLLSGRHDPRVHAFYRKCGFDGDEKQAYVIRMP